MQSNSPWSSWILKFYLLLNFWVSCLFGFGIARIDHIIIFYFCFTHSLFPLLSLMVTAAELVMEENVGNLSWTLKLFLTVLTLHFSFSCFIQYLNSLLR